MLDAWIIEEIERARREREEQRPELRIEIEPPMPYCEPGEEPKEERGVIIIDLIG